MLLAPLWALGLAAQIPQPVSWSVDVVSIGEGEYEAHLYGRFNSDKWHIYDLTDYGPDGPNPTLVTLSGEGVEPLGDARIVSAVKKSFDEIFGMEIGTCEGPVEIVQRFRLTPSAATPPSSAAGSTTPSSATSVSATGSAIPSIPGAGPVGLLTVEWQCCSGGSCLAPAEWSAEISADGTVLADTGDSAQADSDDSALVDTADSQILPDTPSDGRSIWALIMEAIAWGFVALLTPCVFPMVPMTVSFFLKNGKRSHALFFGLSIVGLYTVPIAIIILVTYLTGGAAVTADIFNWLATHWLPNILFFIIFMLFAASFLGAFEITLPASLVNRSDAKSDRGGLAGAFFVALTLVLVSFSCTGPIVGSVLIKSTQGQFWEPILTMLAFSVAFALPFTVLAFAPSLLKKLPKSGSWLGSVKVVLGFVEIALGMKFLSVADQTYHWGILDRDVYLGIWIVVFLLLGLYLLGLLKVGEAPRSKRTLQPEGSPRPKRLSPFRIGLALVDLAFVAYMIPGMWGAPLKALSGYLPPITTQHVFAGKYKSASGGAEVSSGSGSVSVGAPPADRKYADFLKLPYGISAFFDYEEARAYALSCGKPLFLDFTGHGCVNCREMESRVWSDPEVLRMLKEDFVVCALYADDKKVIAEEDWVTTDQGRVLRSLGKVNSWFMQTRFGVNAQPWYAILDPATEHHKVSPRGYDLDVNAFVAFLQAGLR